MNGGQLDIDGSTAEGQVIEYRAGSSGSVTTSTFGSVALKLYSGGVSGDGNTFTSADPVYTNPSYVRELPDNDFTYVGAATIRVRYNSDGDGVWPAMGSATRYWLNDWATIQAGLANKLGAFIQGSSRFIEALGVNRNLAAAFIAVVVVSFALTTLDSATRLLRFNVSEIGASLRISILRNRYVATAIAVGAI